jgi:hypothetical protein
MALANPRGSPLAPLQKGGTGLLVPLLKGDLGGSPGVMRNKNNFSNTLLEASYFISFDLFEECRI